MIPVLLRISCVLVVLDLVGLGFQFTQNLPFCFAEDNIAEDATAPGQGADVEDLSAAIPLSSKQILREVLKTYRTCTSYKDSGIATTNYSKSDGSKGVFCRAFRTAFRRGRPFQKGHLFRFSYRLSISSERGYDWATVLWHSGQETMIDEDEPDGFEKQDSLGQATARLTGVSGGTSHTIPALLMPDEIGGVSLTSTTALRSPTRERLRNIECYRLEGRCWEKKIVLWVEVDSFLILKLEEYETADANSDVETMEFFPLLNEKFSDAFLEKVVAKEWDGLKLYKPSSK